MSPPDSPRIPAFPEEDLRQEGDDIPGYFPLLLGGSLPDNGRFIVVRKLGWGRYSNVWLAKDQRDDTFVALKILTREGTDALTAPGARQRSDELRMLEKISTADAQHAGHAHLAAFHGSFEVSSRLGVHLCVVTEVLAPSIADYRTAAGPDPYTAAPCARIPIGQVKRLTKHVLQALWYLHEVCGIVHADIKHDNIVLRPKDVPARVAEALVDDPSCHYGSASMISIASPPAIPVKSQPISLGRNTAWPLHPEEMDVVLVDFGHSHWVDRHFQEQIQPFALQAPEVVLGYPWGPSADIWNLGCIIAEWIFGFVLFDIPSPREWNEPWDRETELLALMTEILDVKFGDDFLRGCTRRDEFFNGDGSWKTFSPGEDREVLTLDALIQKLALQSQTESESGGTPMPLDDAEVKKTISFLRRCMQLNPGERSSARELLEDGWLEGV
ncbi:Protein kinase dsk1 [Psilocybe cubensis]|uniref:Protein kinase dsk1 n=2 Tax=Psilocybe cubensis TaxID=181762 RepID=A0ACB8GI63_PSICU|nr:Protein kinase dsk1 [Psilocybe cubensis]KAH9475356.1 Protein kinase dsk1 [Psilocybe cubensis]